MSLSSYVTEDDVVFICMSEKSMPRLLAFGYLVELAESLMNDASFDWKNAVRPYSLIRTEPLIQSIRLKYSNPRQLRGSADLSALARRTHEIARFHFGSILETEYKQYKANKGTMTKAIALNIASATEQFSIGLGYSSIQRSWRARYLVTITLFIFAIDSWNGFNITVMALRIFRWLNHKDAKLLDLVFDNFFRIGLWVCCPVLPLLAYKFHKRQHITGLIGHVSFTHACITLLQILNVLLIPLPVQSYDQKLSLTFLQRAARFFSTFSIQPALVFVKFLYVLTVLIVVGPNETGIPIVAKTNHID